MVEPNILYTHITAAALFAYLLQLAQNSQKIPWIRKDTTKLTTILRIVLSGIATLGIHWTWSGTWTEGRSIMIVIPALSVLAHTVWNWGGQYAMQYFGEKVMDVGQTSRIDPKVFNDIVEAIVQRIKPQA